MFTSKTSLARRTALAAAVAILAISPTSAQQFIGDGPVFDDPSSFGPLAGTIHGSGTWTVPAGETLTITAGTNVKFSGGVTGRIEVLGTLLVQGNAASPVFITSVRDDEAGGDTNGNDNPPKPGDWLGMRISPGATVVMQHAKLRYGATNMHLLGPVPAAQATPHVVDISDSEIRFAESDAFDLGNFGDVTLTAVEFSDNQGFPLSNVPHQTVPQFSGLTAANNAVGDILDLLVNPIDGTVTLSPANTLNQSGAFTLTTGHDMLIAPGGHLTLEAGCVIKGQSSAIHVEGTLTCNGTAAQPVVFTSFLDDAFGGDTNGDGDLTVPGSLPGLRINALEFRAGSDASVLKHTRVRESNGGQQGAAVTVINSAPTLEDCTIEKVAGASTNGLRCIGAAFPTVRRLTIDDAGGKAVEGPFLAAVPGFEDITAINCDGGDFMTVNQSSDPASGFGHIVITTRNYPGDVLVLERSVELDLGDRLEIRDGVILKVLGFHHLRAGQGAIDILGTGHRPVVITKFSDDTIAGDTGKDGSLNSVAWNELFYGPASAASTVEHLLVRRFSGRIRSESSLLTLRSVRSEPRNAVTGFELVDLAGPADNLVVFVDNPGSGNGIELLGGSFDLRHATVFGAGGDGISGDPAWLGNVVNSIAFGSGQSDIAGVPVTQVFSSAVGAFDGAFDGVNDNLVADPQFVDALGGDLTLAAGSPALDSAQVATALATVEDHIEAPRLRALTPGGPVLPDRGAFEAGSHALDLDGDGQLGTNVTFDVIGADVQVAVYVFGITFNAFEFPGLGFFVIGLPNEIFVANVTAAPNTATTLTLPGQATHEGLQVGFQAVAAVGPLLDLVLTEMKRLRFF